MSLYALGDLHLAFESDKTMDIFGNVWVNHEEKIRKYCKKRVKPEDTIVFTGDHTWSKKLSTCQTDLNFIADLPGRKILLRGNHDMFWKVKKTEELNELYEGRLSFLQNNFFTYEDYALVGTKGYCFEGLDTYEHFLKIREREVERLKLSFDLAVDAGYKKFIMFLHFPPTSIGEEESPFTIMAKEYGAEQVVYSHCHGKERFGDSFLGNVEGIEYKLVSGDYLNFKPELILV